MNHTFLASVIRAHGPRLTRYFLAQLPEPADASDLLQEVYMRLLTLKRPERIRSVQAYVYRVASSVIRQHWRKRRARGGHVPLEDSMDEPLAVDDIAQQAETLDRLEVLLRPLPPHKRAALVWAHCDGHTYAEISARLVVPKNRVKKYLTKALAQVRKELTAES